MTVEYVVEHFCERCGEPYYPGHRCGYRMVYEKIEDEEVSEEETEDEER